MFYNGTFLDVFNLQELVRQMPQVKQNNFQNIFATLQKTQMC